jgi:calcineurin-like phosphoesterase family protein
MNRVPDPHPFSRPLDTTGRGILSGRAFRLLFKTAKKVCSSLLAFFHPRGRIQGRIFLISDLHFNHARIIRYCDRPYRSLSAMNRDLLHRWNAVVRAGDTVYCLGDFCIRGDPAPWIRALVGRKVFIRGNHDDARLRARHHSVISYGGYTFYLVHDPCDVPASWKGWVIHGHTHNNRPDIYPFINGILRTINVSCECIGYTPVSLDRIISLDLDTIERMETLSDRPVRKGVPARGERTAPLSRT